MKPVGLVETTARLRDGWRVFFGHKPSIDNFGGSRDDVLKSFWIPMLICPIAILVVFANSDLAEEVDRLLYFNAQAVYFAIALVYWPVLMAYITPFLSNPENWSSYVVASNWTLSIPFAMQVFLIAIAPLIGVEVVSILLFGIKIWAIVVGVQILRHLFQTSLPVTLVLVLSDYAISKGLAWVTRTIILIGS